MTGALSPVMWKDKRVLITGGSGSLGSALARHILAQQPARLVIFSRGEHRQLSLAHELGPEHPALRFFIGDVRDLHRLQLAMHDIEVVIHAAALKVVPTIEYNAFEAVETNINGTQNVIFAALAAGVHTACFIGSDKQVSPINTYGATKLVGERLFISANNYSGGRTKFVAVRYGNVAGSTGSIIPLWKSIAAKGEALPLTSLDMTRFMISMPEAIGIIETAVSAGSAGQVFIPRLPSFHVEQLAQVIGPRHQIIGPRPGEKMHEVLMTCEEYAVALRHDRHYVIDVDRVRAVDYEDNVPYASDSNLWWLSKSELRGLVDACL
jgi:UDP-N-acetylglucosamine 4,6-dehydratase/5-epimerase